MTLTADTSYSSLLAAILATELEYGELAYGPNFLLDLKLISQAKPERSVSDVYQFVKSIYTETSLSAEHLESLVSTIDRDETSESWKAEEHMSELTAETFGSWLVDCCLAEEYFETANTAINSYGAHRSALDQLIQTIQPLLFNDSKSATLYALTDSNNENTPYGVYVAIGPTYTLLTVSHWIL